MTAQTRPYNSSHLQFEFWTTMPKRTMSAALNFGARLMALRKAAGYTQTELAGELGVTRRMIAYYEGETEHPPANLLAGLAKALGVTIEQLLGTEPVRARAKPRNSRLERQLLAIEKLDARTKRQVIQLLDTFIANEKLKQKIGKQAA
jgi:transcriptional regulator with XRE-family HTH domain